MRTAILSLLILVGVQTASYATCGTKGGPGYREPNGKCAGWAELGKVCGCPPSTGCTAEQASPEAEKAACMGKDIDKMKEKAHKAVGDVKQ
jgi:predicted small lipoprotein YifL